MLCALNLEIEGIMRKKGKFDWYRTYILPYYFGCQDALKNHFTISFSEETFPYCTAEKLPLQPTIKLGKSSEAPSVVNLTSLNYIEIYLIQTQILFDERLNSSRINCNVARLRERKRLTTPRFPDGFNNSCTCSLGL